MSRATEVAAAEMAAATKVTAAMPTTTAATRQRIGRNGAASQRYGRGHTRDLQQVELHHRRTLSCSTSRRGSLLRQLPFA
jgi:hypothetical protein